MTKFFKVSSVIIGLFCSGAAFAAGTITFQLTNSTGSRVYRNASINTCSPSGATCSLPSSISNGTSGSIVHQAVSGAGVGPLLIARYYYTNSGVTKSCQITITVKKDSADPTKCAADTLDRTFIRTEGTGSSPVCGSVSVVSQDYGTCTFNLKATMSN